MACQVVLEDWPIVDTASGISAHCDLPCTPASAPLARRFVRSFLDGVPPDVLQDVLLLTSELVTNVIVHARTAVHLGVSCDAHNVLVVVQDGSDAPPGECLDVSPEVMTAIGRGMAIIAATADDFGWRRVPGEPGKIMWFSVGIRSRPTAVSPDREERLARR
jgi:anti-sigma regulatory factor (Ser/Thr protein kinase)